MAHGRLLALLALAVLAFAPTAWADDGPADLPAAPPPEIVDDLDVGVVTGDRVNVRVGPRVDVRPVTQLPEGAVLIIVEKRGEWLAVRIPGGFPVAVSLDYVKLEGPDVVRVAARNLNLRVEPPSPGRPAPGIFLDHPEYGALLTLIERVEPPAVEAVPGEATPKVPRSKGWAWVIAPEDTRAFIHSRYVKRLGPAGENVELVQAARKERNTGAERLAAARRREAARYAGLRLMEAVGTVQQDLYRLRQTGGTDKTPVVALAMRLDAALQQEAVAADGVLRLGRALREDLEREITLRVARHDAELARHRGLNPPTVPPLEPVVETFEQIGSVHYEPTPGWKEEGVYFLWVGGRPRFTLRLTTGGPLPHPELKSHAGAGLRRLVGRRSGERLFGLPVLEVTAVGLPK